MAAFCREHAARIDHLHLVDTRSGDEHLPVGMGRIDFEPVLAALADVGWAGTGLIRRPAPSPSRCRSAYR